MAHVGHLDLESLSRSAQEEVGRPSSASDEDALAVDRVDARLLRVERRRDLAYAEGGVEVVEHAAVGERQGEREIVQRGGAHLPRPPEVGVREVEHGERGVGEEDLARLVGLEAHGLREVAHAEDRAGERGGDRHVGVVGELRHDGEVRGRLRHRARAPRELRVDQRVVERHRARQQHERHVAPEAHRHVGRERRPVDERDGEVGRVVGRRRPRVPRLPELDGDDVVARLQQRRDVVVKVHERAGRVALGRQLHAVAPDVGAIVEALEAQQRGLDREGAVALALANAATAGAWYIERRSKPPRNVELCCL